MEVIKLWLTGKEPEQVVDWIHGTNNHRPLPVKTSAGSVQRVLDKHINLESTLPPLAVALEARRAAPKLWDELDRIDAEDKRLTEGVVLLPTMDEQRRASVLFRDKLRGLAQRERVIMRKLRLAGLGDRSTPQLLLNHESLVKTVETDLLEEDKIAGHVDTYVEICDETQTAAIVRRVLEGRAELAARAGNQDRNEASNRPETPFQPEINRTRPAPREVGDVPEAQYARESEFPVIEDPQWTLSPEYEAARSAGAHHEPLRNAASHAIQSRHASRWLRRWARRPSFPRAGGPPALPGMGCGAGVRMREAFVGSLVQGACFVRRALSAATVPTVELFAQAADKDPSLQPLAERMRPRTLDEVVGQEHLLGPGALLRRAIERDRVPSMILWGPPGVGKTTIARLIAGHTQAEFASLSAVLSGVKEIREIVERAQDVRAMERRRTVLFIDEIHRFNKGQQDALLPHVEKGTLILIGATTENPSFEVNAALLSRARVFVLKPLGDADIVRVLQRALHDPRGLAGERVDAAPEALELIAQRADGDARKALVALEIAAAAGRARAGADEQLRIEVADAAEALGERSLRYDKGGEEHYNLASAFIKSMRGSDPDAALYYLTRMLEAGEPPRFVLRRMVIFAAEDIGNADTNALRVAVDALQAAEFVGLPEAVLPMSMAVTYLALAPKSNSALTGYGAARKDVVEHGALDVPMKIRNAPTSLMQALGYSTGYKYPHNFAGHYVPEAYLPEKIADHRYYQPSDNGDEARLKARLEEILKLRTTTKE
jgi:putative ATPase